MMMNMIKIMIYNDIYEWNDNNNDNIMNDI